MTIWKRGTQRMINLMGIPCSTDLSTGCLSFNGIFNQNAAIEEYEGMGMRVIGSTLLVSTTVAEQLTFNSIIKCDNKQWYARQWTAEDDGEFSTVVITEKPNAY